ncbi:MAG: ATPase, T2SS/T4P/T4SS family [Hyphomicrobium sp.]
MTDVTNDLKLSMWDDEDPVQPGPASSTSPSALLSGTPIATNPVLPGPGSSSPTAIPGMLAAPPAPLNGASRPPAPAGGMAGAATTGDPLDWELVAAFRARASTNLTQAIQSREALSLEAQRELGRSIILELLNAAAQEAISDGSAVFDPTQQQRMAQAIFDALFGLGRLQPLVDDERVENVEVYGCDDVLLEHADGSLHTGPAVAESDQELIEFLGFVATRSEGNARSFSEARPRLHMRLDNGSRLAASAWVTPRPAVVIRRHRLSEVTLEDLVARGTMTPVMASFVRAGIRARKSCVVSGPQGGGKTTTLRAMCAVLDPYERIGTFETEYELHLHELPERHRRVVPYEARPGSGERGLDGRPAGEITIDELLYDSFRMNLSRQIVGEVRGPEVIAMFKAMQSGSGSLSTTHAGSAADAIDKLITCALEAGPHITEAYAQRAVARHINLIVHMALVDVEDADGVSRRRRYVSEIIAVHRGEGGAPSVTDIFRRNGRGPGTPHVIPDDLARDLVPFGFDIGGFNAQIGQP